jgi:methionine aminopeptidase
VSDQIAEIRRAVADYMSSEGCSCCRDMEAHVKHAAALGKLLQVPEYEDGSGYDFRKFRTTKGGGA